MVVGVLLVEDALDVKLESEMFGVVKGGDDDTEGELFGIVGEVVCLLQPGLLRTVKFLYLLELILLEQGVEHVPSFHQPVVPSLLIREVGELKGDLLEFANPLLPNLVLRLGLEDIEQDLVLFDGLLNIPEAL